jgi:Tfp pilus assembly protein FimT
MKQNGLNTTWPAGLTLVEILAMMLIMGVIAAVVIPLADSDDKIVAASGARMVLADLEYAQSEAIRTRQPVTVTFDAANDKYTITIASGTINRPGDTGAYVVSLKELDPKMDLGTVNFGGGTALKFLSTGDPVRVTDDTALSTAGTIPVSNGDTTYNVKVLPVTGKVRVVEAN